MYLTSMSEKERETLIIPYSPNEWQKELHVNPKKRKVLNIHRQAGKTTYAVAEIIKQAIATHGLYWYVAPTYQAAYDIAWRKFEELIPKELIRSKHNVRMEIQLKNNSLIQLKGCEEPDRLRGRTLEGVVIDEFASVTKQKELWEEVIEPTLLRTKGWVQFLSTPKGKNHFWLLSKEAETNPNWFYKVLTVEDTGVLSKDEVNQLKSEKAQDAFAQEYMCDFLEGEGLVFRGVNKCVADVECQGTLRGHRYQMGVDLARKADHTVITVVDKVTLHTVFIDRFNQIDWPLQKARIEAVFRRYKCDRAIIDSTGVGDPIIQDLERMGVAVEPYQYTSKSKKQLIDHLAILIEQQKVRFPNHGELVKELQIFGFERTPSGNTKYEAPHGFHDDCVNSLALAYWGLDARYNLTAGEAFGMPRDAMTSYQFDYD